MHYQKAGQRWHKSSKCNSWLQITFYYKHSFPKWRGYFSFYEDRWWKKSSHKMKQDFLSWILWEKGWSLSEGTWICLVGFAVSLALNEGNWIMPMDTHGYPPITSPISFNERFVLILHCKQGCGSIKEETKLFFLTRNWKMEVKKTTWNETL